MIEINDKHTCCGCQACHDVCPSRCITMVSDNEGFLYPEISIADCVNCGLCEKVCPERNVQLNEVSDNPLYCYAAISKDMPIRRQSSSGGVFSLLANAILDRGGVVFGARFDDNFMVYHSYTETEDGLSPFRGSKYAQSDLHGAYTQTLEFLKGKRPVLFTGTPCQIAGLRGFLHHKEYEDLYLVSIVCHGVPSPLIWNDYLGSITGGIAPTQVNMRNKDNGWSHYQMTIQQDGRKILNVQATTTPYMKAFLNNLTLRPACYSCHFRGNHGSDITIGDYWGIEKIHPEMSDDKGTSLILIYTQKGQQLLNGIDLLRVESQYGDILKENPSIIHPAYEPVERTMFWRAFRKRGVRKLEVYTTQGFRMRARKAWARLMRKIR